VQFATTTQDRSNQSEQLVGLHDNMITIICNSHYDSGSFRSKLSVIMFYALTLKSSTCLGNILTFIKEVWEGVPCISRPADLLVSTARNTLSKSCAQELHECIQDLFTGSADTARTQFRTKKTEMELVTL
jgi:hypothetical protein